MRKARWGVLGAAKIAVEKVIPAMQRGRYSRVDAIASRTRRKARRAADDLGIPKAYGSYEELLEDPDVDAIYNPLPNHLHVPWTLAAVRAGKHVLCEKPIGLDLADAKRLLRGVRRSDGLVQEAFTVKTMPQWLAVREPVRMGSIGALRAILRRLSLGASTSPSVSLLFTYAMIPWKCFRMVLAARTNGFSLERDAQPSQPASALRGRAGWRQSKASPRACLRRYAR